MDKENIEYGRKYSDGQIEMFVNEIYVDLLKGVRTFIIRKKYSEKFGVSTRQIDDYISKANQLIIESANKMSETAYQQVLDRLMHLYAGAVEKENEKVANMIMSNIIKITGLQKTNVDLTSGGDKVQINLNLKDDE